MNEGDEVEEDQIVGSAETDKAVVDIPSPATGVVKELKASTGENVQVGDVIMILNKDASEESNNTNSQEKKVETPTEKNEVDRSDSQKVDPVMGGAPSASSYSDEDKTDSEHTKPSKPEDNEKVLALPKVRKKAEKLGINLSSLDIEGRITEEDLEAAAEKSEKAGKNEPKIKTEKTKSESPNARPSVKRLAREKGVNLSELDGSGRGGEITRSDVENATEEEENIDSEKPDSQTVDKEPEIHIEDDGLVEKADMNGVRVATAKKMVESKFSAPHVTHVEKADITELVELRESVKAKVDAHLTYLPFIMKALLAGLKEYPDLNAELDEENNQIIRKKFYDFNIAVDTDKGLLVPKIEDVDSKNMVELAEAIGIKAEKAQNGNLSTREMEPGTFSITNLGVIGGEEFTPIIYPPQTAILGIGKIKETAEVVDGKVVPRTTVKLSLSYDHRIVDGANAARFMNKIVEDLENPRKLILEL